MLADSRQQLRQDPGTKLSHAVQGDGGQLMANIGIKKAPGDRIGKLTKLLGR